MRQYGNQKRTLKEIHTEMLNFLWGMREDKLDALTAQELAAKYTRLRPEVLATELAAVKRERLG